MTAKKQSVKMLENWEKERGIVFLGDKVDPREKLTEDEFLERFADTINHPYAGVDVENRTAWLKYNGYDVTRENLIDSTLPTVKLPKELLIDNAPE